MTANRKYIIIAAIIMLTVNLTMCEFSGNSIESEETPSKSNIVEKLRAQIRVKEKELENAEKINKNFERMIQLVNIMGQVDTFLTDRTRLVLKKLAMLADDMDSPAKKSGPQYNIKF